MNPVLIGNLRTLVNNHVIQGYQVHKGVSIIIQCLLWKLVQLILMEYLDITDTSLLSASHLDQFR